MRNFIIRLIACFIFSKEKRRKFRNKYMKVDPIWIVSDELKQHINKRIAEVANTMFDAGQIPIAKGFLREVQTAKSKLLAEVINILNKHNINYWLDYGTLLGAYRNKGFIPWDDDLDIGITGPDFERLKEILKNDEKYELADVLFFRKKKQTTYRIILRKGDDGKDNSVNYNLCVDIFPYNYIDCQDSEALYDQFISDRKKLHKELGDLNLSKPYFGDVCKDKKDLEMLNEVYNKYKNLDNYKSKDDGEYLLYSIECDPAPARRIFKKETIFPLKEIEFEGVKYLAPNNTEKYLSVNYGDFTKLPNDFGHPKHFNYSYEQIKEMTEITKNL